jgi:hypothetical protein
MWMIGLFTGHSHLKGHLLRLGLTDDPKHERCLEKDESATHIPCDCEAIAYLRFRHLGQFFMEAIDYYDVPINRVLHFIRSVGLIKVNQKGKHNRSLMVMVQGQDYYGPPLIHLYSTGPCGGCGQLQLKTFSYSE